MYYARFYTSGSWLIGLMKLVISSPNISPVYNFDLLKTSKTPVIVFEIISNGVQILDSWPMESWKSNITLSIYRCLALDSFTYAPFKVLHSSEMLVLWGLANFLTFWTVIAIGKKERSHTSFSKYDSSPKIMYR